MSEIGRAIAFRALQPGGYGPAAPAGQGQITEVGLGPLALALIPIASSVAAGVAFGLGSYAITELLTDADASFAAQPMDMVDWLFWGEELGLLDEAAKGLCYHKPGAPGGPEGWGMTDAGYYATCPALTGAQLLAWEISRNRAEARRPGSGSGEQPYQTRFEADFSLRALRVGLAELKKGTSAVPVGPGAVQTSPPAAPAPSSLALSSPGTGLPSPWVAGAILAGLFAGIWFMGSS